MATPSTRSVLWALALAGLLPSCTDDPADPGPGDAVAPDPRPITWRVPCGATVHRDDRVYQTHRYTYDDHKRLTSDEQRDTLGRVTRVTTQGWVADRLAWQDVIDSPPGGQPEGFHTAFEYSSGGFLLRVIATDRDFGDGRGSDGSHLVTYGYDRTGARISADLDYVVPGLPNSHTTITGDLTEHVTEVACGGEPGLPSSCSTQTWERPDRDPDHWTQASTDYDSDTDDLVEYRDERTLDAQGLPLTHARTGFGDDPAGVLRERVVTQREPDGTELERTEESFTNDGESTGVYRTVNHFTCE